MAAEKAIKAILSAAGDVTTLINDRIYPAQRPQGSALPAITFQQVSGSPAHNVDGPIGWVESRYQITCWAAHYQDACDLAKAAKGDNDEKPALDGYSGTIAGLAIDHIFVIDEGDMPELAPGNVELEMHGKRLDVRIVFKE